MHWSVLCEGPFELAECPVWFPQQERLLWTDIDAGRLWACEAAGKQAPVPVYRGRPVGGFTLQEDGNLLLFRDRGNIVVRHEDGCEQTVVPHVAGEEASRFNDVVADPVGRVFCGTLTAGDKPGRLYRLDPEGDVQRVADGFGTPNGMGFTPAFDALYVTDSRALSIWRYAYDVRDGGLGARELFYRSPVPPARPDGLCVDAEGCVWTALFEGGVVLRLSPQGEEMQRIALPARFVTSLCFGPAGSGQLFVTSARGSQRPAAGEHAGAIFALTAGVAGGPVYSSRIHLPATQDPCP